MEEAQVLFKLPPLFSNEFIFSVIKSNFQKQQPTSIDFTTRSKVLEKVRRRNWSGAGAWPKETGLL